MYMYGGPIHVNIFIVCLHICMCLGRQSGGLRLSITTLFVETGPLTKAGTRLLSRTRALPVPIPSVPLVTDPCHIGARVPHSGTHAVL